MGILHSFTDFLWLESGTSKGAPPHRLQQLGGFGVLRKTEISSRDQLGSLDAFIEKNKGYWILGHIGYESRSFLEPKLHCNDVRTADFCPISFFVPRYIYHPQVYGDSLWSQEEQRLVPPEEWQKWNTNLSSEPPDPPDFHEITLLNERDYHTAIDKVFSHLQRGDIYEMNYCIPFAADGVMPDPVSVWQEMQTQQAAPFGALYRREKNWLLCSSPERWLTKAGLRIISQPIKGTARRGRDPETDHIIKRELLNSEKEKAENIMIVDLVRNDLGRIAETGSVQVDELLGLYSFPAVHQLISTISATLKTNTAFTEILKAAFPMGSMTGAPKISAMEIIQQTEIFDRGLYSGSVGYIDPQGNFDFNVVIRSILYNQDSGRALFPAGSAITVHCDPTAEYHECLLKSNSMRKALRLPLFA